MRPITHWPWFRRLFGDRSERAAARFLRKSGLRILVRNYRAPDGEIDLVVRDGPCLVFVEVRSTAGSGIERIAASIDQSKQRRVTRAARHFLHRYRLRDVPVRFDVILVTWGAEAQPAMQHIRAAFDAAD